MKSLEQHATVEAKTLVWLLCVPKNDVEGAWFVLQ